MSLTVIHLRWNDPGADRYEEIVRGIPEDGDLPSGCLSRQLRRQGGALLATEVWDRGESGGPMDDLVTALAAAGVEETPQVAMFSVPAMFAVGYRRPGRPAAGEAAAAAIPMQREAPGQERLPEDVPVSAAVTE
jgi:hypothetical protein